MKPYYKNNVVAVIPAYNEENSIGKVICLTKKYVDHIIVYNDGSSDMTYEIVSKLGVNLINSQENKGKGYSLRLLFKEAIKLNPDIIITLDADGQHDPYQIPKIIEPIIYDKADLVIGSRFIEGSMTDISFYRNFGLRMINFLHNMFLKSCITDTQSGFRAFSAKVFNVVLETKELGYGIESEELILASKMGVKIIEVPINIKYKGLFNTSKKFFILHGLEVIFTLFQYIFLNALNKFKLLFHTKT